MITYEAFASGSTPTSDLTANPASTLKSMCESTRLDAIELILINLSNYKTCHDCSVMLLRRPGEQDYPRYPNTYLFHAFRARMPPPATLRHAILFVPNVSRHIRTETDGVRMSTGKSDSVSQPHTFILWVSRETVRKGVRESRGRVQM